MPSLPRTLNEVTPLLRAHQQQSFSHAASGRSPYQDQANAYAEHLMRNKVSRSGDLGKDPHSQFCALTGCPPHNAPPGFKYKINERTLYGRATSEASKQRLIYQLTSITTNFLLLAQIVLGAALTGLGGTHVPGLVITLIGAVNTVIAGLITYLKSRGQPNRARMFYADLETVVDEIENSEVMWLGISKGAHGYLDIDTDNDITVRSEVARLTVMLEEAIIRSTQNNPESYSRNRQIEFGLGTKGLRSYDYSQVFNTVTGGSEENDSSNQKPSSDSGDKSSKQATFDLSKTAVGSALSKGVEDFTGKGKETEEQSPPKAESSKQADTKGKEPETSENAMSSFSRTIGSFLPSALTEAPKEDVKEEPQEESKETVDTSADTATTADNTAAVSANTETAADSTAETSETSETTVENTAETSGNAETTADDNADTSRNTTTTFTTQQETSYEDDDEEGSGVFSLTDR